MMKKLIIILVCCLYSFTVLGETKTYTGKFAKYYQPYYVSTNYKIPEPFGIELGQPLDRKIILKINSDTYFDVNPKFKNNMFDEYRLSTKLNDVVSVVAVGLFFDENKCINRRDYLLTELKSKYPEGTTQEDGDWIIIQAQEFEYENGNTEWIAEFEIKLECSSESNLYLAYMLRKGELNLRGID